MELADKFKLMAMASKDAIEDFNDFAEDRVNLWAFDEITRLTAAVESLTTEKEAREEIERLKECGEVFRQNAEAAEQREKGLREALTEIMEDEETTGDHGPRTWSQIGMRAKAALAAASKEGAPDV